MMKLPGILLFFLMLMTGSPALGQVTLNLISLPSDTEKNARIFLASPLNQWNPGDENYELKRNAQGQYSITIPSLREKLEYKITRGSWDTAEGGAGGKPVSNRILVPDVSADTVNISVASWEKPHPKPHTLQPNVVLLHENFLMPQLNKTRRIWIYLPLDYTTTKKRYPVIYMHDAQNLFDEATSFAGEWAVDETLNQVHQKLKKDAIVVGIEHGGESRLDEYSPWNHDTYGGGKGSQYSEFLANTLKPFIDKHYRTRPQPKYTGLIGSSMGGLISLYTGVRYPNIFGKLGLFSPAFWFASKELNGFIQKNGKKLGKSKFYFVAGKNEMATMPAELRTVVKNLRQQGVPSHHIKVKIDDYGTHTESYWRSEFQNAYFWLFLH